MKQSLDSLRALFAQIPKGGFSSPQASIRTVAHFNLLYYSFASGSRVEAIAGKKIAAEMRNILLRLVDVTNGMDEEQIKRILRAIKKAFESVIVVFFFFETERESIILSLLVVCAYHFFES
jgi:hypothetical protein